MNREAIRLEDSLAYKDTKEKEYRWFNPKDIINDYQVGICRLELPLDLLLNSQNADVYISVQILSNQMLLNEIPSSTHYATIDPVRNAMIWDYTINFPIKVRDLASDSLLLINAYTADHKIFGSTTLPLFDPNGILLQGKQKLMFYFDLNSDKTLPISNNKTPGRIYDVFKQYDIGFQMEKALETYRFTFMDKEKEINYESNNNDYSDINTWLDRLSLSRVQTMLSEITGRRDVHNYISNSSSHKSHNSYGCSAIEKDISSFCFLIIELPVYSTAYKVLYEEQQQVYTTNRMSQPHIARSNIKKLEESLIKDNLSNSNNVIEFTLNNKFNANCFNVIADWESYNIDTNNIYEDQHRHLSHSNNLRGSHDITLKPNLQEKEKINKILHYNILTQLNTDDMDLIFKFRYTLVDNNKALIKYLTSVNWKNENEANEVPKLLGMWKDIEVADALKLLGKEKAFNHRIIREYAVNILKSASDDELLTYLLQLVQALRYEQNYSNNDGSESFHKTILSKTNDNGEGLNLSPLARFLIDRGSKSAVVANYIYWYLRVEVQTTRKDKPNLISNDNINDTNLYLYQTIFKSFMDHLKNNAGNQGLLLYNQLIALENYLVDICNCQISAREVGGKSKDVKQEALRKYLKERKLDVLPGDIPHVPFPLNPSIQIIGLNPSSARMFASAIYPAVISFNTPDSLLNTTGTPSAGPSIVKMMFKCGDDLRQDQLIMQMFSLMDNLLKKVNLDLKLNTYGILALSKDDGLMEFVDGSDAVSAILSQYKTIQQYLRTYNEDPNGPYGINSDVFDNFIKSTAASCVVTYLLGVGDRHLDNIMMKRNGQLFHIDFGFIFGQDPKPLPPPFRFTRHMAECLGGEDSNYYNQFKSYCCQAYNWLRKSADLILNLLALMADAGIKDISQKSTINNVLESTLHKFRLDLSDEHAEHFFCGLINDSLYAFAPRVMEFAHQIAVAARN